MHIEYVLSIRIPYLTYSSSWQVVSVYLTTECPQESGQLLRKSSFIMAMLSVISYSWFCGYGYDSIPINTVLGVYQGYQSSQPIASRSRTIKDANPIPSKLLCWTVCLALARCSESNFCDLRGSPKKIPENKSVPQLSPGNNLHPNSP